MTNDELTALIQQIKADQLPPSWMSIVRNLITRVGVQVPEEHIATIALLLKIDRAACKHVRDERTREVDAQLRPAVDKLNQTLERAREVFSFDKVAPEPEPLDDRTYIGTLPTS